MKRQGSVAIVPLIIGLMVFFWFIWFLGGESDLLHEINKVEHLEHIQEELIYSALQERIKLEQAHPDWSDAQLDAEVNAYVTKMMEANQIQEGKKP